jgi:hypothetical protein
MESDAASVRIEHGICEYVIDVDQHRAQHDQSGLPPMFLPEQPAEQERDQKVERPMNDRSEKLDFHYASRRAANLGR